MGAKEFDVFVIGTGKSGKDVAVACVNNGLTVAIADNREFGGVCANRGCDPKKVLASFAEILARSNNLQGNGISKLPEVSWADLQKFKAKFTDAVPYVHENELKDQGIELYHQSPKFIDENTLSVEGKTIKAKKIVIATGQKPLPLNFEGSHHLKLSEDFLSLEKLPESMVFIGGGYVAMEFAHIAARFGVKVTVIHSHERPLNNFDPDMVDHLVKVSEEIGIRFIFNAQAKKIETLQKNYKVYADKNGKTISVKGEMIFNAAGRVPAIDELNLESGKVEFSKSGIAVDENLQNPTNKNVYACGDVSASSGMPLTPLAPIEGRIVASHILKKQPGLKAKYPPQPSVVFTWPNLAKIGLSEKEAKRKYKNIEIRTENASDWYSAKHTNDKIYAYKVIIHTDSKEILGAHFIGRQVGELVNLFALAMANNLTIKDIKNTIFAYPTWGRDMKSMV